MIVTDGYEEHHYSPDLTKEDVINLLTDLIGNSQGFYILHQEVRFEIKDFIRYMKNYNYKWIDCDTGCIDYKGYVREKKINKILGDKE
jgi:hypothetical protein